MDADSELLSHICDLAERSFDHNLYTFSNFLSLGEQSVILNNVKKFSFVHFDFSGGSEGCERKIIRFGSSDILGYEQDFPILTVIVKPVNQKFSDSLSHRDFLGAVMNLGIERDLIGDIVIRNNIGYIFSISSIAEYICDNLSKVRNTSVSCSISDICPECVRPSFEDLQLIIQSDRADSVISKLYNISRNQSLELFKSKNIFIDGRLAEKANIVLKEGAVVSVRGYGKFIFDGILSDTRKGRIRVAVRKYI